MSHENVPDSGFLDAFGERFGAAWNSHEPDRLLELMTDDIVYQDSLWPETMRDHGQVREFLQILWRALPDLEFEDLEGPFLASDAPTAVYRWRGTGTFTGLLEPHGFAPTGARVAFEGFELLEFQGDSLCRLRIVYDILGLYRQMGIETTPVAGTRVRE